MTGNNVTKLNIVNNLVEKIVELLGATVSRKLTLNSRGESTRKIVIEYQEQN